MIVYAYRRGLPDTKARKYREYDFAHVGGEFATYVLVIRQGKPGTKAFEEITYAVQDVETGEPRPKEVAGIEFLLAKANPKEGDTDAAEVYKCTIPDKPEDDGACTCIGQSTQRRCKHLDALFDVVYGQGHIEPYTIAATREAIEDTSTTITKGT